MYCTCTCTIMYSVHNYTFIKTQFVREVIMNMCMLHDCTDIIIHVHVHIIYSAHVDL